MGQRNKPVDRALHSPCKESIRQHISLACVIAESVFLGGLRQPLALASRCCARPRYGEAVVNEKMGHIGLRR